jgi:hypothetical protein
MAKLNKAARSLVASNHHEPQQKQNEMHLLIKSFIPGPLDVRTIGHSITELEWNKFYDRHLIPKLRSYCERKNEGTVHFFGEYGLEAALELQHKFPGRFHFVMNCLKKEEAALGLYIAKRMGLKVTELHYKNGLNDIVNISDRNIMDKLLTEAARIAEQFRFKSTALSET